MDLSPADNNCSKQGSGDILAAQSRLGTLHFGSRLGLKSLMPITGFKFICFHYQEMTGEKQHLGTKQTARVMEINATETEKD